MSAQLPVINPKSWRRPELQSNEVTKTLERLLERIFERFPKSGLSRVCIDLIEISKDTQEVSAWIVKPNLPIRLAITALMLVVGFALGYTLLKFQPSSSSLSVQDLVSLIESATSELVLLTAPPFQPLNSFTFPNPAIASYPALAIFASECLCDVATGR